MSYNLTVNGSYDYEIAALNAAIKPFVNAWRAAISDEEQSNIESQLVRDLDNYLNFKPKDFEVVAGQLAIQEDFDRFWSVYEKHLTMILAKLEVLNRKYLNYANAELVALKDLKAIVLRLNQKVAALNLWNNEEVKYALSEYFSNKDMIDSKSTLEIHNVSGVATLPVAKKHVLQPQEVLVGRGSVGRVGNSNLSIRQNINLSSLFYPNSEVVYFENLNAEQVRLQLRVVFQKPEVINGLYLKIQNPPYGIQPYVDAIQIDTSEGVIDLESNGSLLKEHKSFINNEFHLLFLPVIGNAITFDIIQTGSVFIQVQSQNRLLSVKQSLIALEYIELQQFSYQEKGTLLSLAQAIPEGLFVSEGFIKGDLVSELQRLDYQLNTGNGFQPAEDGATHLLSGESGEVKFSLTIEKQKNPDLYKIFSNRTSEVSEVKTQTKLIGNTSPVLFTLKDCYTQPFVYIPYQLRRGPIRRKIFLTRAFNTAQRHRIPFDLKALNIEPQKIKVFVNGVALTYVFANPNDNQFSINQDLDSIILNDAYESGSEIEIVVEEEELIFEKRPDGFYTEFKALFDPDKETIEIKYLPATFSSRDLFLAQDKKVIYLPDQFLNEDSVVIKDQDGTILSSEANLQSIASPGDFYLDAKNGVVYLDTPTGDDTWSISYKHRSPKVLDKNDYTVIFQNNLPWGIRIKNDKLFCFTKTETKASSIGSDLNQLTGLTATRDNAFSLSDNKKVLSYKNILKGSVVLSDTAFGVQGVPEEVPHVDGITEFLGLISLTEETTAIEEAAGLVSFTLSAGGYWYKQFGLVDADTDWFANAVANLGSISSIGDYFISNEGVVTLKTGSGTDLPSGLTIRYYYKDPQFKPGNKYSVDYTNGTVYSYTDFADTTTFTYKVANYTASYDLVSAVKSFEWKPLVKQLEVNLDLAAKTKFLKAAWQNANDNDQQLNLKDYYSPIIDHLGIRFY